MQECEQGGVLQWMVGDMKEQTVRDREQAVIAGDGAEYEQAIIAGDRAEYDVVATDGFGHVTVVDDSVQGCGDDQGAGV